jgi:hypothetical protein
MRPRVEAVATPEASNRLAGLAARPTEEVLATLGANPSGLSADEARVR